MKFSYFLISLILVGLGWWFVREVKERIPTVEDQSVAYPDLGREHIPVGAEHPPYNSNPPSSGWHYGDTAKLGFYDVDEAPVPDENLIHNLEHGEIWIAYHPRLNGRIEVMEMLRNLADESLVIVTPRLANDSDIALVAWGRVDKWNAPEDGTLDTVRIRDFITHYRNRGPEKIPASEHLRK